MTQEIITIILSTFIASNCVLLGIICLLKLRRKKRKEENFFFFMMCLTFAFWSFTPAASLFYKNYFVIANILMINSAIIYFAYIIHKRILPIFIPLSITMSLLCLYITFVSHFPQAVKHQILAFLFFPIPLAINIILYYYTIKEKNKLLLLKALLISLTIIGGAYESVREPLGLPNIYASLIPMLCFIGLSTYFICARGYLNRFGWKDYYQEFNKRQQLLKATNSALLKANIDSAIILAQTIEAKDPYTIGHCIRVRNYAREIGKILKYNDDTLMFLELSALLHDIGKIGVPLNILNKKECLTIPELREIKKHPEIGAGIIKNVAFYDQIIPIIKHHHECFDGRGYPEGLKGYDIPQESRIIALADIFDALTSERPYRNALTRTEALINISKIAGTILDPEIVDIFITNQIYAIEHHLDDTGYSLCPTIHAS